MVKISDHYLWAVSLWDSFNSLGKYGLLVCDSPGDPTQSLLALQTQSCRKYLERYPELPIGKGVGKGALDKREALSHIWGMAAKEIDKLIQMKK